MGLDYIQDSSVLTPRPNKISKHGLQKLIVTLAYVRTWTIKEVGGEGEYSNILLKELSNILSNGLLLRGRQFRG